MCSIMIGASCGPYAGFLQPVRNRGGMWYFININEVLLSMVCGFMVCGKVVTNVSLMSLSCTYKLVYDFLC